MMLEPRQRLDLRSLARRGFPRNRWTATVQAIVVIAALYVVLQRLWPSPPGVIMQGVIVGALSALSAFGLVLVYRANKVINFAQADLGIVPTVLAVCLMNFQPGVVSYLPQWHGGLVPFWIALPIALAAAALLGWTVEWVLIRRFQKAPRLILMVATIGLAQILAGAGSALPSLFQFALPPQQFPDPFNFSFSIAPIVFHGNDLMALVAVVVVSSGLYAFLRFTNVGVAIRAAAESSDRAALLGVSIGRIQGTVWIVAALLATIATLLRAGIVGVPVGTAFGPVLLLPALAAAVIGRMENYAVIFVAAAGMGVIESAILWNTGSTALVSPVLFVLVLAALLLQRRPRESRADDQATSSWKEVNEVRPIPRELARLPEVRWGQRGLMAVLVLALLVAPRVLGEGRTNLMAAVLIYAIVAVSLVILTGWTGEISLGHIGLFGLGAALSGSLNAYFGLDPVITILAAGFLGAVVAFLIGLPALRIRGLFLAVTTLAFSLTTSSYILNRQYFPYLPDPFSSAISRLPLFGRIDVTSEASFYYLCLAVLGLVLLAARGLQRSRTARVLIATRENERAAQAFGINVTRARLSAFALSGFFASLAGGLFVLHQQALGQDAYQPTESIRVLSMVVVGGLGSIPGALLGTLFVKSTEWFNNLLPQAVRFLFTYAGSGIGLLFVLLWLRGGLGAVLYRIRDRLLRLVAKRRNLLVPSLVTDLPEPHVSPLQQRSGGDPVSAAELTPTLVSTAHREESQ